MTKQEVIGRIHSTGILPVVRAASGEEAMLAVDALYAGGVTVVEITMTVPGAVAVIEELRRRYGDEVTIGAGTALDAETARACILAGAQFVVSPALNVTTIEMCRRYSIAVLPGALTPTEIVTAWQAGADMVKVFPCSALGGASYLKALKVPLPHIELIPTGGVSLSTVPDFIEAGAFALGVGADLVDTKAIRDGQPEKVTEAARAYVKAVREARGKSYSRI
ncbi:MAG: bifunctional 2-keto-4-hydroxyglutarate aldolase/2-keto-3-deoxy-6-phosphogluconate aldolase [Pyrinomonadaceae bacterium MAG19_C2-C3]|nr:bifunctional 2-keto-4-hydroxyglutarate aldolase/2-keto-3-deoxy-6-phosphogluconate aldolase [Pyrinomonadaceae bacterium MAG19_C2-C3]